MIAHHNTCQADAQCRTATTRAYSEMIASGARDPHAFNAAVRVFQFHHPDARARDAQYIVADWLDPESLARP